MIERSRHYEEIVTISASTKDVFDFVDDHSNFSAHMGKSSWITGGGSMSTSTDEGKFRRVGSHLQMEGRVLGIKLFLDEVITRREPPKTKVWETVGSPRLLVIGLYKLGFEIEPMNGKSTLKVFIDYQMPRTRLLGQLFGGWYAKWCVNQMIKGVNDNFKY